MPRKQNVFQKINSVRREVDYIKKDLTVQGYKAVSHDAVTAQIRNALIKHNLIITPPSVIESKVVQTGQVTSGGTPVIRYEAKYNIAIVDGSAGQGELAKIDAIIEAHANDTGDKAPGKAMSYATKYFILKLFNLETGEDEEGRIATADQGKPIDTGSYVRMQDLIAEIEAKGDFDQAEFIDFLRARGMAGDKLTDVTQGIYPIAMNALQKKLSMIQEAANG